MDPILIFASLATGALLTLLFGPQWGIMMGLITFLAGLGLVQQQEIAKLKAEFERRINELPDLVHRLVEEKINALLGSRPASPVTPEPRPAPQPQEMPKQDLAPLEERFAALDSKITALVDLLIARETQSPTMPAKPSASPYSQARFTASSASMPQAAMPKPTAFERSDPLPQDQEIAALKEMIEKMAAILEMIEKMAAILVHQSNNSAALNDLHTLAETLHQHGVGKNQRPNLEHLRAELDKIAHEVSNELKRNKGTG